LCVTCFDPLRRDVLVRQVAADGAAEAHALERRVALLPRREVGVRNADAHQVPLGGGLVDVDEAVGLGEGKRAQEEAVEDTEDRSIAGDPDGEHEDDRHAEARLAAHHPKGDFEIVQKRFHQVASSSTSDRERLRPRARRDCEGLQLRCRGALRFGGAHAGGGQLLITVVQVQRELLGDLGLARRIELHRAEPLADPLLPIRHIRLP
jgi:hypothetical protein